MEPQTAKEYRVEVSKDTVLIESIEIVVFASVERYEKRHSEES